MKTNFSPGIASAKIYRERGQRASKNNHNITLWRTYGSTSTPKMQKDLKIEWQQKRNKFKSETKINNQRQKRVYAKHKSRLAAPTKHSLDVDSQNHLYRTYRATYVPNKQERQERYKNLNKQKVERPSTWNQTLTEVDVAGRSTWNARGFDSFGFTLRQRAKRKSTRKPRTVSLTPVSADGVERKVGAWLSNLSTIGQFEVGDEVLFKLPESEKWMIGKLKAMHPVEPDWDGREVDHRYVCDIVYTDQRQDVTVQLPDSALKAVELGDVDGEDNSVWRPNNFRKYSVGDEVQFWFVGHDDIKLHGTVIATFSDDKYDIEYSKECNRLRTFNAELIPTACMRPTVPSLRPLFALIDAMAQPRAESQQVVLWYLFGNTPAVSRQEMQTQYVCWHNLDPDMAKQALDQAVALATNIQLVDGADIDLTVSSIRKACRHVPLLVPHVTVENFTRPKFEFLFSVVMGLLKAHRYHKELISDRDDELIDKYSRRQFLENIIATVGREFPPIAALDLKARKITAGKECDSTRAFLQYLCLAANFQRVPLHWYKSIVSPHSASSRDCENPHLHGGVSGTLSVALSSTVAQLKRRICASLGLDHTKHWLLLVAESEDDDLNQMTVLSSSATLRQCAIPRAAKIQLQYKYSAGQRCVATTENGQRNLCTIVTSQRNGLYDVRFCDSKFQQGVSPVDLDYLAPAIENAINRMQYLVRGRLARIVKKRLMQHAITIQRLFRGSNTRQSTREYFETMKRFRVGDIVEVLYDDTYDSEFRIGAVAAVDHIRQLYSLNFGHTWEHNVPLTLLRLPGSKKEKPDPQLAIDAARLEARNLLKNKEMRRKSTIMTMFSWADQNDDGFIDVAEMRRWCTVMSQRVISTRTFRELCKMLDCDPDRGLTQNAFLQLYDDEYAGLESEHTNMIAAAKEEIFSEGMSIECNYRGNGKYYRGEIASVHHNGTVDVIYPNDAIERWVEKEFVRKPLPKSKQLAAGHDPFDEIRMLVRQIFHSFTKADLNLDGFITVEEIRDWCGAMVQSEVSDAIYFQFCNVLKCNPAQGFHKKALQDLYDDQFRLLDESNWKAIDNARVVISGQNDGTTDPGAPLPLRTAIECDYAAKGIYYPGVIAAVHNDGTYDIGYVDGVYEYRVEPEHVRPRRSTALLVVDVQNDWIDGSLSLKQMRTDKDLTAFLPVINKIHDHFDNVIFSQDWHPRDHCSFYRNVLNGKTKLHHTSPVTKRHVKLYDTVHIHVDEKEYFEQIMWPAHCIEIEHGSGLHPDLLVSPEDHIIKKGKLTRMECYSAFGNLEHQHKTKLLKMLQTMQVTDVYICGVATELGVKYTALDALKLGFSTTIVEDACRGMNKNNIERAKADFRRAGGEVITSDDLLQQLENSSLATGPGNTPRDTGGEGDALAAIDSSGSPIPLEGKEEHQPAGKDGEGSKELATAADEASAAASTQDNAVVEDILAATDDTNEARSEAEAVAEQAIEISQDGVDALVVRGEAVSVATRAKEMAAKVVVSGNSSAQS